MIARLYNFDEYKTNLLKYDGNAGKKQGLVVDGQNVIVKFPTNLELKKRTEEGSMKNVELKYASSQFSEYLGSHLYELLGYDVHKTVLGYYKGFLVVGCVDFTDFPNGKRLVEFEKFYTTYTQDITKNEPEAASVANDLQKLHTIFKTMEGVTEEQRKLLIERFWDMFVLDAYLGNSDRHTGNFGFIQNSMSEIVGLAPVYDLGNCLSNKIDTDKAEKILESEQSQREYAYNSVVSPYVILYKNKTTNDDNKIAVKRINPFQIIDRCDGKLERVFKNDERTLETFNELSKNCDEALLRVVPKLQKISPQFLKLIDEVQKIPYLEEGKAMENISFSTKKVEMIKVLLQKRLTEKILPAYKRICEKNTKKFLGQSLQDALSEQLFSQNTTSFKKLKK